MQTAVLIALPAVPLRERAARQPTARISGTPQTLGDPPPNLEAGVLRTGLGGNRKITVRAELL